MNSPGAPPSVAASPPPRFDERDKLVFQLNYGDGIGSYVNDLSSIGNFDGVFEPDSDNLELFDVSAGYVSWQHWWGVNDLRSNFTFGAVEVDNPDFVGGDAYKQTLRLSTNLIWSRHVTHRPGGRIPLGPARERGRRGWHCHPAAIHGEVPFLTM